MKSLKVVLLFVASIGLLAYGCAKSDDSSGGGSTENTNTNKYSRSNTQQKAQFLCQPPYPRVVLIELLMQVGPMVYSTAN